MLSGEGSGSHSIQGIGAGFVPDVFRRELIDDVVTVHREDAITTARKLATDAGEYVTADIERFLSGEVGGLEQELEAAYDSFRWEFEHEQELEEAVAPDGGRTGDVRDRLVVDDDPHPQDDLEPRTQRAVNEAMDVSLLSKGGRYEVQSASGNRYEVDVIGESCTCPDWQQRTPEGGCKHMRRVDHEIKRGRVPRPDGRLPSE